MIVRSLIFIITLQLANCAFAAQKLEKGSPFKLKLNKYSNIELASPPLEHWNTDTLVKLVKSRRAENARLIKNKKNLNGSQIPRSLQALLTRFISSLTGSKKILNQRLDIIAKFFLEYNKWEQDEKKLAQFIEYAHLALDQASLFYLVKEIFPESGTQIYQVLHIFAFVQYSIRRNLLTVLAKRLKIKDSKINFYFSDILVLIVSIGQHGVARFGGLDCANNWSTTTSQAALEHYLKKVNAITRVNRTHFSRRITQHFFFENNPFETWGLDRTGAYIVNSFGYGPVLSQEGGHILNPERVGRLAEIESAPMDSTSQQPQILPQPPQHEDSDDDEVYGEFLDDTASTSQQPQIPVQQQQGIQIAQIDGLQTISLEDSDDDNGSVETDNVDTGSSIFVFQCTSVPCLFATATGLLALFMGIHSLGNK